MSLGKKLEAAQSRVKGWERARDQNQIAGTAAVPGTGSRDPATWDGSGNRALVQVNLFCKLHGSLYSVDSVIPMHLVAPENQEQERQGTHTGCTYRAAPWALRSAQLLPATQILCTKTCHRLPCLCCPGLSLSHTRDGDRGARMLQTPVPDAQ